MSELFTLLTEGPWDEAHRAARIPRAGRSRLENEGGQAGLDDRRAGHHFPNAEPGSIVDLSLYQPGLGEIHLTRFWRPRVACNGRRILGLADRGTRDAAG